MTQKIFMCDKCGAFNIYFDCIDECISCGEQVDFNEVIWDDGETDEFNE